MRKRWWLAIGMSLLAVAGVAVGLSLALTSGGGGEPKRMSHDDYQRIWFQTGVGDSRDEVLARWPKVPYQHYTDNLKDEGYEWRDERRYIYNLCFADGVLRTKDLV